MFQNNGFIFRILILVFWTINIDSCNGRIRCYFCSSFRPDYCEAIRRNSEDCFYENYNTCFTFSTWRIYNDTGEWIKQYTRTCPWEFNITCDRYMEVLGAFDETFSCVMCSSDNCNNHTFKMLPENFRGVTFPDPYDLTDPNISKVIKEMEMAEESEEDSSGGTTEEGIINLPIATDQNDLDNYDGIYEAVEDE